jgi:hypothetical protein
MRQTTAISEYGVAAISALVGLMADEMISRLRDVFRTVFGIPSLQADQEFRLFLPKSNIPVKDSTPVCAILSELKPTTKDKKAIFMVQDPYIAKLESNEIDFDETGLAVVMLTGLTKGETLVTAMVESSRDLFDSLKIKVE